MDLSPEDQLAGANGKLVLFLASLLQRANVVSVAEFGELLDVFALSVGETDPAEGRILAQWAAATRAGRGG